MTVINDDEVRRIAVILQDPPMAKPCRNFPDGQADVDAPGLYSWWVDEDGRATFTQIFGVAFPGLIYAGQAGATSSRAGVERSATLLSRINGNHLRGNIRSSTFRQTLSAVLFGPLGLELEGPGKLTPSSNAQVSKWMRTHLHIATVACPNRATLAALEDAVLAELDPPLNLMGMPRTPVRRHLKELRTALR